MVEQLTLNQRVAGSSPVGSANFEVFVTTIGSSLKETEEQKKRERIAHRSELLRKFVKEDLLAALQANITAGHNDYAPVLAPKEIRHLFAAALDSGCHSNHSHPRSAYRAVWDELDEWAKSEDLFIRTGHNLSKDNYSRPWDDYDWGGSLGIRQKPKPEPVRPTPPPPQIISKGVPVPVLAIGTIAVILAFVLYVLGAFK